MDPWNVSVFCPMFCLPPYLGSENLKIPIIGSKIKVVESPIIIIVILVGKNRIHRGLDIQHIVIIVCFALFWDLATING